MPTLALIEPYVSGRTAARVERVLAVGRAFLTVSALFAIYLDPTEPARLREVTYGVLLTYAISSLLVLVVLHSIARVTPTHARVLHGLDILWTSALTFVSEGPISPFFLFFLFVVLAAAYRWGFRETAGTAVVTIAVFLLETGIAAAGPWGGTWPSSIAFELNRTILRVTYLLLTGVLLGYLAEQQKHSRAELAAIAAAARQPHVNIGLGGSVTAFARTLSATFHCAAVTVVVRDLETRRTLMWELAGASDDARDPPCRRTELTPDMQAVWLFEDWGRGWCAVPSHDEGAPFMVRVTEPDVWRLSRRGGQLPAVLRGQRSFDSVTAVNLGLPKEWQARAYMFDVRDRGGFERRLHFLDELAEHVTPGLTNVFLLRRLRARAGAAERARVARELHDGAIQALFGIEMRIEAMRRDTDREPRVVEAELREIQEIVRQEVLALRELMQALRPMELDSSEQLPDVLVGLVERFRRDSGISARFIAVGGRPSLSPQQAIEVVRIVQEGLVNVRKHSHARNVLVRLDGGGDGCRLLIEDDGRGFEFEGRLSASDLDVRRLGPAIIKERARVAGAQLVVDSTPGAGARVELTFVEDLHA